MHSRRNPLSLSLPPIPPDLRIRHLLGLEFLDAAIAGLAHARHLDGGLLRDGRFRGDVADIDDGWGGRGRGREVFAAGEGLGGFAVREAECALGGFGGAAGAAGRGHFECGEGCL